MDRTQSDKRLAWLAGAILLWTLLIVTRLVVLQVVHHTEYLRRAQHTQEIAVEIPAPRGSIFDRAGRLLAMSTPTEAVFVNPLKVPDRAVACEILSRILALDRRDLYARMTHAADHKQGYLVVKSRISAQESDRLRGLHLEWIGLERRSQRHYPSGSLGAHVLGSVDHDERGNGGIEQSMEPVLHGQVGTAHLLTDVRRRGIVSYPELEPRAGRPLTLTIDERIQFVAERELARAVQDAHGRTGSAVVMNPYSGDVLALASYPTFDPNQPPAPGDDPACRFNHAVSVPFEPGSCFKVMTYSAAFETTRLRPESIVNCGGGAITLFGRTIHEAHGGYGSIPAAMAFAKSSNIGAIQVGLKVGPENFYDYVRRFGFGQTSGIELPAESKGKLRKLNRWGKTSLASMAMGHEISVTTVQLARACAVIANGGLLVKPRLILRQGDASPPAEPPRRILRPETAITMRQMMEGVVLYGTGRQHARLDGYTSGGKTGSAQIFDLATHHFTHFYNASFVGFAPVTNPAIVIVVTVNGTHLFGGTASAPAFKVIAEESLRVLNVPRDLPETLEVDQPEKVDVEDAAIAELGDDGPNVMEDTPADEEADSAAPRAEDLVGPQVPDFQGKTMRAVVAEASARGLPVVVDGSGIARLQQPPPGSVLHPGERIRVRFAR